MIMNSSIKIAQYRKNSPHSDNKYDYLLMIKTKSKEFHTMVNNKLENTGGPESSNRFMLEFIL